MRLLKAFIIETQHLIESHERITESCMDWKSRYNQLQLAAEEALKQYENQEDAGCLFSKAMENLQLTRDMCNRGIIK